MSRKAGSFHTGGGLRQNKSLYIKKGKNCKSICKVRFCGPRLFHATYIPLFWWCLVFVDYIISKKVENVLYCDMQQYLDYFTDRSLATSFVAVG